MLQFVEELPVALRIQGAAVGRHQFQCLQSALGEPYSRPISIALNRNKPTAEHALNGSRQFGRPFQGAGHPAFDTEALVYRRSIVEPRHEFAPDDFALIGVETQIVVRHRVRTFGYGAVGNSRCGPWLRKIIRCRHVGLARASIGSLRKSQRVVVRGPKHL